MNKLKHYITENKGYIMETLDMAWPSVVESVFVALAGMVDSLMVSSLGASAVAAVGLTTQPKFIALALFIALKVAISAIVARRRGEGDRYGANQTLLFSLIFVTIASLVISAAAVGFAEPIIKFCGAEEDTFDMAVTYLRIIVGGMFFNVITMTINAAQRGAGQTRISMTTNVVANVVNVILNYLLIGGHFGFPALGIEGAALATVLGTVVASLMSIRSILLKDSFVSIPYMIEHRVRPALRSMTSLAKAGSTMFLEQILIRIGFMLTALMTAALGTDAFAAHQVSSNIMSLSFAFGDGMQAAAVALIGRSLGEKNPELAKRYGAICQRIGNVISICLAIVYLTCGHWLYGLFFEEEHIVAMGVQVLRCLLVIVMLQICAVIYTGCLRAGGDNIYASTVTTSSILLVRTSVSYLCCYVFHLGLMGIWMGVLADQFVRFVCLNFRFRSGIWTKGKL